MKPFEEWTLNEVEAADEETIFIHALGREEVKGYRVYFINLRGAFGYSACVFKGGRHIYYVNDYELHHQGKTHEELRDIYIEGISNKLFTEEEICAPLKDYEEYDRKGYFLVNYYHMEKPYVSTFRIIRNEADKAAFRKEVEGMIYNPYSYCYMAADLKPFIEHQGELFKVLHERRKEAEENFEYMVNAFKYEMYNHEYIYDNYEADYSVLSAFGRVGKYWGDELYGAAEREKYFDALGFTETQRRAYAEALRQYYKEVNENECY